MTFSLKDSYGRTAEERAALKEAVKQANAEVAANWHDSSYRRDLAQLITETTYEGFEHESLIDRMTTVSRVGWEDRETIAEVRGLKAVWVARGGYIEASSIRKDVMEMPRDIIGYHVYELEDKVMSNFGETNQNLISLGQDRLNAELNSYVLRTFQSAIGSGSPSYMPTSGLTLASLNTALAGVRDSSRQHQVAIVGRATMTEKVLDLLMGTSSNGSGFLPASNEEMLNTGRIGTYRGAEVVTLTNFHDDADVAYFPGNELFVLAPDSSKFVFYGGPRSKEWTDNATDYWHFKLQLEAGFVVHRPERARRIVDSSVAAA